MESALALAVDAVGRKVGEKIIKTATAGHAEAIDAWAVAWGYLVNRICVSSWTSTAMMIPVTD